MEEALCERFEVRGYPTLKYFTAETGAEGEAYEPVSYTHLTLPTILRV